MGSPWEVTCKQCGYPMVKGTCTYCGYSLPKVTLAKDLIQVGMKYVDGKWIEVVNNG